MKNKFNEIRELTAELVKDTQDLSKSILGGVFAQSEGQMEGLSGVESLLAYKEAQAEEKDTMMTVEELNELENEGVRGQDFMDFTGAGGPDEDR